MKLSIVTVNKDNAKGLSQTIQSIRKQSFQDFELIIIDGNSSDNSKAIIEFNKDIISKSISEPDNGVYDAMNKALPLCKGEYIIFMNSGDMFYNSNTLQNIFKAHPKDDIIYGDVYFDKLVHANKDIHSLQDFYCKSPFCHQAVFTRTLLAQKIRFDTNYKVVADWIMFVNLFIQGHKFQYIPEIIARCETGGISSNYKKNTEERLHFLSTIYPQYILEDYQELLEIKKGVLWNYYQKVEKTKKIKYWIFKLLKFLHI